MNVRNLMSKTGRDKTKIRFNLSIWTFIVYPFISVFTVVSFVFVFFTILPAINSIGLAAFGHNEVILLSYGILPFICIDMCIVQGYFFILKKMIKKIIIFYRTGRIVSHG